MMRTVFLRALAFAALWWILAEGRLDGWLLGSVAVVAATWASITLQPPGKLPLRLAGLVGFVRFFLWNSLRGGLQVAAMALRGRAALRPAIVELPITLPAGGARILLVNALGLMPGTVAVDLEGSMLRLHVLDDSQPVVAETRALEAAIASMVGAAP
jgi:multicomponent Na+:H+ antiporter subunit E